MRSGIGAVLTGANRSTRKRAATRANAVALYEVRGLHTPGKAPMLAKREHQSCGFDKLGVTGSSPVRPIFESPGNGLFRFQEDNEGLAPSFAFDYDSGLWLAVRVERGEARSKGRRAAAFASR